MRARLIAMNTLNPNRAIASRTEDQNTRNNLTPNTARTIIGILAGFICAHARGIKGAVDLAHALRSAQCSVHFSIEYPISVPRNSMIACVHVYYGLSQRIRRKESARNLTLMMVGRKRTNKEQKMNKRTKSILKARFSMR